MDNYTLARVASEKGQLAAALSDNLVIDVTDNDRGSVAVLIKPAAFEILLAMVEDLAAHSADTPSRPDSSENFVSDEDFLSFIR